MLVKIFNRGKGQGEGPIGYLLGEKFVDGGDIRAGARVLSGDAFITQELINSSNFAKRYTSGVLSFEERPDQISEQDKKKIMQDFEQSMFPGMNPDRVNFLWVEHTDKKNPKTGERRLELNFVIPNIEVYTGKRLQPYYHLQDAKYFRAWQALINNRFKLSDPDDPSHFRTVNPFDSNQSPKKTFENLKQGIAEFLEIQLKCGLIESRDDVIWQLENNPYVDVKVTRRSPKFISVVSKANQKPIRLKGFLFEEDFSYAEYQSRLQNVEASADTPTPTKKIETAQSKDKRVEKARSDFTAIYEHKKNQNIKKYGIDEAEQTWVARYYAPMAVTMLADDSLSHANDLLNSADNLEMEETIQQAVNVVEAVTADSQITNALPKTSLPQTAIDDSLVDSPSGLDRAVTERVENESSNQEQGTKGQQTNQRDVADVVVDSEQQSLVMTKPSAGLAGAFLTYSADVKALLEPSWLEQGTEQETSATATKKDEPMPKSKPEPSDNEKKSSDGLAGAFVTYSADVKVLPEPPSNDEPDDDYGPGF